jgi:type II secretory pathway pseudopilin PulG
MLPRHHHPPRSDAGFTLLEVLVVGTVVIALLAVSTLVLPGVVATAKADSGSSHLMAALRTAREQAVTERRSIAVLFFLPDRVEVRRDELGVDGAGNTVVTGQTLIGTTLLEQGMEFRRFLPGVPDTPDGFAAGATAVDFTGLPPWQFTPEGTLVSQSGDVVNGTVFLGRPDEPQTARAITLFGATALLREWKWNGAAWVE